MAIPRTLLRRLYTYGSLHNVPEGVRFTIKNRLHDAQLIRVERIAFDGKDVPLERIYFLIEDGQRVAARDVSENHPLAFPLGYSMHVLAEGEKLKDDGSKHRIDIVVHAKPFGRLAFDVKDVLTPLEEQPSYPKIPRDPHDDYSPEIVRKRQEFVEQFAGVQVHHIKQFSFDPHDVRGNIENFTGVAQIPLGFAGPLRVNGEHAKGDFLIPLATSEGALVASYNRGIKVLNLSGGVTCTVQDDRMQRAPVFIFNNALEAREFVKWVHEHFAEIKEQAEATTRVGKLIAIDPYLASKFAYLRFNYYTGDAAGQNMAGKATFAACAWILDNYPGVQKFYLEANFATDKKASVVNILRTRGKRVTAEATIPREVLIQQLRVEPETLAYHYAVGTIGAFMAGANNNGAQSPNAITAMFIATGQDVANVSESSAAIEHAELTPEGDLYISLTIPSLIVATVGGGTKLPTARECLEIMGCYGSGKVKKFAEIVAGVALAGELSLGAAISSLDWVAAHERYARPKPIGTS